MEQGRDLQLFNTLTGRKEKFRPLSGKEVRIYVCGPTVYDVCHMGHARSYTVFDVLVRYLRLLGYEVRLVINFTDVEERITDRAEEAGENPLEFAEGRIQEFFKVMDEMGIGRAESYPRVSMYVPQMIGVVEDLLDRGYAYHLGGKIFFDVNRAGGYGDLLHVPPEEAVVQDDPGDGIEARRRGQFDFEVWDGTVEKEPIWDSPWGKGRIGWHIECYVMSKILGHPIDIKGGGLDLVFPHHESTKLIASALGEELSKFYMHNAFLTYNKQKMSKSKGICVSISDGLESHDRETLRFFLLGLHYRKNLNYTDDDVVDSATKLGEIKRVVKSLARSSGAGGGDDSKLFELTALLENEFYAGMEDDLDTPRVLDALSDFASSAKELDVGKSSTAKALEILGVIGSILGFDLSTGAM